VIHAPLVSLCLALAPAQAEPPPVRGLQRAWRGYVATYGGRDGRVVDPRGEVTTSEGQAYALLRAAWQGDRRTFGRVRAWTRAHLQGGDPGALLAWRYGRGADGALGVLDPQPAADADLLWAYALLLGAGRFGDAGLEAEARAVAAQVWERETLDLPGGPVLLPGPWAAGLDPVPQNPSYFLPFALRALAAADPAHDWTALLDRGYRDLEASLGPAGLPPDWSWLDRQTGRLAAPPPGEEAKTAYGFEALRVPWNLAADHRWHGEPRALAILGRMDGLGQRYARDGRLSARIGPSGEALEDYEYPGMYAALLPALALTDPAAAARLWSAELEDRWGCAGWRDPGDYYFANWLWFGVALWSGAIGPVERAA
jgi:endoglucanase